MPARKLSEIVSHIEAATDRQMLEASVVEGLAVFGVAVKSYTQALTMTVKDPDIRLFVDVILSVARIRSLSLPTPAQKANASSFGLSSQQFEVLSWAAKGKSNGDIATILGQSRRAIEYHMSEILRKLGVTSRAQAIALGVSRR